MANDAFTQQALSVDPRFRQRVRAAIAKIAWQVLNESTGTTNHTVRAAYARTVISNVDAAAIQVAPWLVMRPNLGAPFVTSYDFQQGAVVTTALDADIESQLSTDWDRMSGV